MNLIFDWIFAQYEGVPSYIIFLEAIGVVLAIASALLSKRENILVFPTGIASTLIFVYILWVYILLGDMLIQVYYFIMSIWGWWFWTQKVDSSHYIPITKMTVGDKQKAVWLFIGTLIFVFVVYLLDSRFNGWTVYVDTLTTGLFFVGTWLLARKKLENWLFLLVGDLISIPLYVYKGLIFSSFLYLIYTFIAAYGYYAWKKNLGSSPQTLLK